MPGTPEECRDAGSLQERERLPRLAELGACWPSRADWGPADAERRTDSGRTRSSMRCDSCLVRLMRTCNRLSAPYADTCLTLLAVYHCRCRFVYVQHALCHLPHDPNEYMS